MKPKTTLCILSTIFLAGTIGTTKIDDSTETYSLCPRLCTCDSLKYLTDCAGLKLKTIPNGINKEVQIVDLSYNSFTTFPKNISEYPKLQKLYLQYNNITNLRQFELNTNSLELLELSHNYMNDWNNVHNLFLQLATSIKELRLSSNPMRDIKNTTRLSSRSLETLYLSNCLISYIPPMFLSDLPSLKRLILSENKLFSLAGIQSSSLMYLDVSMCHIHHVYRESLHGLPVLETLIMRSNNQLKLFKSAKSESLKFLDVSKGNLEDIDLKEFPNLILANISDNHVRRIPENCFINKELKTLDLSHNAISSIEKSAFSKLKSLEVLNLSANTITDISPQSFIKNQQLYKVILSRNYLTSVINFSSVSLLILDLSVCEIQYFSRTSLLLMPAIKVLNLSRNVLKTLPNRLVSNSLQMLDVSICRLSDILNETFVHLTELQTLNLAGNRLTSGLKPAYFPTSLKQLILDDNLWHCACYSHDFRQLNNYLRNMEKHSNYYKLVCHSPENVSGHHWWRACAYAWNDSKGVLSHSNKVWLYAVTTIFTLSVLFCLSVSIRRMFRTKQLREQEERERQAAEAHERIRQLRIQQAREAQQNAPDPRELMRPPSYAEAVLMPRLDGSYASLTAISAVASTQTVTVVDASTEPSGAQGSRAASSKPSSSQNGTKPSKARRKVTIEGENCSGADLQPETQLNAQPSGQSNAQSNALLIAPTEREHIETDSSDDDSVNETTRHLQKKTLESNL